MDYCEYIIADMQKARFKKIDERYNYFCITVTSDKEIDLVDIKEIDYKNRGEKVAPFLGMILSLVNKSSFAPYRRFMTLFSLNYTWNHSFSHIWYDNIRS